MYKNLKLKINETSKEEKNQELDDLTTGMIEKGQDLDLDLSFLKDELSEKSDDSDKY